MDLLGWFSRLLQFLPFLLERHNGPSVLEGNASEGLTSGQEQPPLCSFKKAKNMNNYWLFSYFFNICKVLFLVIDNQLSRMELSLRRAWLLRDITLRYVFFCKTEWQLSSYFTIKKKPCGSRCLMLGFRFSGIVECVDHVSLQYLSFIF